MISQVFEDIHQPASAISISVIQKPQEFKSRHDYTY